MDAPFLELRSLTKSLGGRVVLDRLDLEVRRGETLVILGVSGSGKSVTLRHVVGLLHPDAGQVVVDGQDVSGFSDEQFLPIRRKVAFIFQSAALFDSLSVGENVAFGLVEQRRLAPGEIAARVRQALEEVGLGGSEDVMPVELSGGMRKRVSVARSMALDPECLLYDEPTAGLDPLTGFRVSELIRASARRRWMTSVVVTHDIPAAFFVADRVAFLHQGRIAFVGTPEEARSTRFAPLREFLDAYRERA